MKRIKQEQHIEIEEKSQQLKFRMQTEIQIDKHHALCQVSGQLEELDYTKLYFAYSGIRKSQIEPRVLFKVLVCAYMNYAKTREVYATYRKAGYSKAFLEARREEIALHKAAKAAFDEAGLQKLPKVKALDAEFAELLTKKKADCRELTVSGRFPAIFFVGSIFSGMIHLFRLCMLMQPTGIL